MSSLEPSGASPAGGAEAVIFPATPEQSAEFARMHQELFLEPWDRPSFEGLLRHPGAVAFVAHLAVLECPAGFILGRVVLDEAEILSLGVLRLQQRRGIATRLVEAFAGAARRAGVCRLHLEVCEHNGAAIGLYRRLGFREVGRRPGYYRPGALSRDALLLVRALCDLDPLGAGP